MIPVPNRPRWYHSACLESMEIPITAKMRSREFAIMGQAVFSRALQGGILRCPDVLFLIIGVLPPLFADFLP